MINIKQRILAYRNQPLPISEIFVYNQTIHLARYEAHILGAKWPQGPSIPLPRERVRVVSEGGVRGWLREFRWKVLGRVPEDILHWARMLRPMLVHAHSGPDGVIVLPITQTLGIPLIVSFRGQDATLRPECANTYAQKKYVKHKDRLITNTQLFIAVSDFIKQQLVMQGFPDERIVVHYNGVSIASFSMKPIDQRENVVLFVGRLVPKKGCKYLIETFSEVLKKVGSVKLVIIGDGPERGKLELLAKEKLDARSYEFVGLQPHKAVAEWMNKARVLCVPAVTGQNGDSEGLPNVVLEAMASELPVIGTRHAGIPEAVVEGETGLLCAEADVESLGKNLIALLENQELCRKMGEGGRKRAERFFNLEIQNAKLERLYEETIRQQGRGDARRG